MTSLEALYYCYFNFQKVHLLKEFEKNILRVATIPLVIFFTLPLQLEERKRNEANISHEDFQELKKCMIMPNH